MSAEFATSDEINKVQCLRLKLRRAIARNGVKGLPTLRDFLDAGMTVWAAKDYILNMKERAPDGYATPLVDPEKARAFEQQENDALRKFAEWEDTNYSRDREFAC